MTTHEVIETSHSLGIPFSLHPDPIANPEHICAMASLYGFESLPSHKARVLILGCGRGDNLLPFALANPDAKVIGIDIDDESVQQGEVLRQAAGADNVQLGALSLNQLVELDVGKQDYIFVQGDLTYLDHPSRQVIIAWCRQSLSSQGIIAIRWPCHPGARHDETLRDAMLLHSSLATSYEEQVNSARAIATFLALGSTGLQNDKLQSVLKTLDTLSDTTLALRYLSGMNEANYLVDFNQMVEQNGLCYLGDAQPWTEIAEFYGDNVQVMLNTICPQDNKVLRQQYLDFATSRSERFSLLVVAEHQSYITSAPELSELEHLNWAGNFRRYFSHEEGTTGHITNDGKFLQISHPLTLTVLDLLGEVWPYSLSFDDIVSQTAIPGDELAPHRQAVMRVMRSLFMKGIPALHTCKGIDAWQRNAVRMVSGHKSVVALMGSEHVENILFNFWYETVDITPEERALLRQSELKVNAENYQQLENLRHKGLLMGSPQAWQRYYQQMLLAQDAQESIGSIGPLLLFSSSLFEQSSSRRIAFLPQAGRDYLDNKQMKKVNGFFGRHEYQQALHYMLELQQVEPNNPGIWYQLSQTYLGMQDHAKALDAFMHLFALEARTLQYYQQFVMLLIKLENNWHAEKLAWRCLRHDDKNYKIWTFIARITMEKGQLQQASGYLEKAIAIEPGYIMAASLMGNIYADQSNQDEALIWLRKTSELAPSDLNYMTNYLFALLHHHRSSADYVFKEHCRYGQRVTEWAKQQNVLFQYPQTNDPTRRLRIGFVSGDLRNHPVSNFILPIWLSFDTREYELYAYHTYSKEDGISDQLKEKTAVWRSVAHLSQVELARQINDDQIDVLIDLSGHTNFNRLQMFGLRPAPVSMSFLGYPGTTGLQQIDYYLAHNKMSQPGELDSQFTEALIHLPFNEQFTLFQHAPDVTPSPVLETGRFTFGSFNRPNKINDEVLVCWAEVLNQHGSAQMLIGNMVDDDMIARYEQRFAEHGINSNRLIFRKRTGISEYLRMHAEVDMLLDAFPYPGGTTTNFALQMGVVSLTLVGGTFVSRQGASNLRQFDLDRFVVSSTREYISRALEVAKDIEGLNAIRLGMRDRIRRKGLHGGSPAVYLQRAVREAWGRYCRGEMPSSFCVAEEVVQDQPSQFTINSA
ncbi:methyltransferase regulatory domain-containing protein [Citrobacter sp. CK189]|uniref:O-linked N-acetylglucosamine transferase family protein n=1 Tax=Citrobacter sp. CK189 TaxID=2985098 RepID=UPI002578AEDF|nr:methyltransferase regulatory domain-containing protein [Citrobacter sp. CK189]MDM3017227.1 methyltransferase regulatory domain-containing protein [Citrobacter sp. CK189]